MEDAEKIRRFDDFYAYLDTAMLDMEEEECEDNWGDQRYYVFATAVEKILGWTKKDWEAHSERCVIQ